MKENFMSLLTTVRYSLQVLAVLLGYFVDLMIYGESQSCASCLLSSSVPYRRRRIVNFVYY